MGEDRIKLLKIIARELGIASRSIESVLGEISKELVEPIKKTAEESILEAFYALEEPASKTKEELIREIYYSVEGREPSSELDDEDIVKLLKKIMERIKNSEESREDSRDSS